MAVDRSIETLCQLTHGESSLEKNAFSVDLRAVNAGQGRPITIVSIGGYAALR